MATYNNKHWLLSHIRTSFISTDDTGKWDFRCKDYIAIYWVSEKSKHREHRRVLVAYWPIFKDFSLLIN